MTRRVAREDPLGNVPRIQSESALSGHHLAESIVAKYLPRRRRLRSPTWRTFLPIHVGSLVSIDFVVVPTVTFRLLYGFEILRRDRR